MTPTPKKIIRSLSAIILMAALGSNTFAADFDSDGKADIAVFRPSNSSWYINASATGESSSEIRWGIPSDVLVPGDYDGDKRTDIAVWRPQNGVWYIQQSGDRSVLFVRWGMVTMHPTGGLADIPVPADYDADGRTDIAVWRPDTGEWWILTSSSDFDQRKPMRLKWGKLGDVPVEGDYDGDLRVDQAVFRTTENRWYIRESSGKGRMRVEMFGLAGSDKLVPADYDGDGRVDIASYRSGIWYMLSSRSGEAETFHLGFADSIPVPADYDGDGVCDLAVYRSGTWYVYDSGKPLLRSINFGLATDSPVGSGVVRESIVMVP